MAKNNMKRIGIKISTSINIITFIALLTAIILSFNGYRKINLLRNNIESVYNEDVKKLELSKSMATSIAIVETDIKGQLSKYDSDLDNTIQSNIDVLYSSIETYSKMMLDKKEKQNASNLSATVNSYNELWNNIKNSLATGNEIDDESRALLIIREQNIIDNLNKLVRNNTLNAQKKCFSSKITAQRAEKQFFIISLSGISAIMFLALMIMLHIKKSLKSTIEPMNAIACGNLKATIDTEINNEFGVMNRHLQKTVKSVSNMISKIIKKTDNIVCESKDLDQIAAKMLSASKNVYNATKTMAEGSAAQAQDLINIDKEFDNFSEKLNDMINAINKIAEHNKDIDHLTLNGENEINIITLSSQKVSASFDGFNNEFNQFVKLLANVNDITEVITDISTQTQLLSLNASIEAARAGEAGRGFAVVAGQVSKLSEESRKSADEITKLIETISNVTKRINNVTEEMRMELENQRKNTDNITISFRNIINNVEKSSTKIDALNNSASMIINQRNKLVDSVVNASSIAEEISASSQEITESASKMDLYAGRVVGSAKTLINIVDETNWELNKFEV